MKYPKCILSELTRKEGLGEEKSLSALEVGLGVNSTRSSPNLSWRAVSGTVTSRVWEGP